MAGGVDDPRATAQRKLEALGIEAFCDMVVDGLSYLDIADELGIGKSSLIRWLAADPDRSARADTALILSAQTEDEKAEAVLKSGRYSDPIARELASHYRWRAKARAPKVYGDKMQLDATVKTHELPDDELAKKRAAIAAELERLKSLSAPASE